MEPMPGNLDQALEEIRVLKEKLARLEALDARGRLAEERLNLSLSAGQVAWWEMDVATGRVDANEWKPKMLDRDPGEFAGCHYTKYTGLIHPEDHEKAMKAMADHIHAQAPVYECEYRIQKADGSWCWFYDKGSVTQRGPGGRPLTVKGVVLDITARKENEVRLEAALADKNFLLREIHHRIKNNLNLISMLIFHMEDQFPDRTFRESLRKLTNRISSMASLHQLLHREGQVDRANLAEYLENLACSLVSSFTMGGGINLELSLEPLEIDHNYCLKLGLLVNELVTNALKYAFGEGRQGTLSLKLLSREGGFDLLVANDGPPLDRDRWVSSESLGRRLVTGFVQELGGELEIFNNPGPHFQFRFPERLLAPDPGEQESSQGRN